MLLCSVFLPAFSLKQERERNYKEKWRVTQNRGWGSRLERKAGKSHLFLPFKGENYMKTVH